MCGSEFDSKLDRIMKILQENKFGLSISDISRKSGLNRNSVSKYLNMLVTLGQAEVQIIGPARVYHLSSRVPVSPAYLASQPEPFIMTSPDGKILQINTLFCKHFSVTKEEIIGSNLETSRLPVLQILAKQQEYHQAIEGKMSQHSGWLNITAENKIYRLWIVPAVFFDGTPGVLTIMQPVSEA